MSRSEGASPRPRLSAGFIGIIVFKCLKGAAFILLGLAVLHIARLARHSEPMEIARLLGVDQNKLVVQHLSLFLGDFTAGQVQAIGAAAFLIGLIFATEGTFLAMRIWWGPWASRPSSSKSSTARRAGADTCSSRSTSRS
jgi:hypothetical protein